MRSKLRRLRMLVRRYRIDRRLPPPVLDLYKRTTALRTADRAERATAGTRRILGESSAGGDHAVARLGPRRLQTADDLEVSTADLGHEVATAVSTALADAGVAHFVTDSRGDGLAFGVELTDRTDALKTLATELDTGWFLEWADGSRSGIVALPDAAGDRQVRRARSWIVFRAHRWGDSVVGAGSGTEITFWDLGTSGQLERVGTRSQERFDPRCPVTTEVIDGRSYPGRTAFPVGANFEHVDDPIDIVYTWVDGSDPAWIDAFRAAATAHGRELDEEALDPARYRSRDELKYSLRSVWAYCGWVRKIWIVTAGQRPTVARRRPEDPDRRPRRHPAGRCPSDLQLPCDRSRAAPHRRARRAVRLLQRRHAGRPPDPPRAVLHSQRTGLRVPEWGSTAGSRGRHHAGRRHGSPPRQGVAS